MSLRELVSRIEEESASSSPAAQKEAEREAAKILDEARERAEAELKSAKEKAKAEVSVRRSEAELGARFESELLMTQARSESISREARVVTALVKKELAKSLPKIVKRAFFVFQSSVPKSEMVAVADQKNAKFARGLGVTTKVEKGAGICFYSKDKKISMRVSLDDLMALNEEMMRNAISKILFKESKG